MEEGEAVELDAGRVWREKENDCVFGSKQTNLIFGTKRRRFRSIVKCLFLFGGKTKNVFGFSVLARLYIDAVALREKKTTPLLFREI